MGQFEGTRRKTLTLPIFDDAHNTQLAEGGILDYVSGKVEDVRLTT